MSKRARDSLTSLIALAIIVSTYTFAEPPSWAGGGRGGGGKPDSPDLYGDMVIIDRDINGVPITTLGLGPKDEWMQVPQPIMLGPKTDCPLVFSELEPVGADSIYQFLGIDARYVPLVDGEIPEAYAACSTEAEFGRLSSVRSPELVIDHALEEMVTTLSKVDQAGEYITLDEAGRLVAYTQSTDPETGLPILVSKTIDAPMENMAAFQRILETGELYHENVLAGAMIDLPVHPAGQGPAGNLLHRVAAMLGTAADKYGRIDLDVVVYTVQILGVAADMSADAQQLFGMPYDGSFFNFSLFDYDRATTYAGNVCYLKILSPTGTPPEGGSLPVDVVAEIVSEPILPLVFPPLADAGEYVGGLSDQGDFTGFTGTNVWAFAQAADDARAVIQWTHDHPVPIELLEYCQLAP